ncbi:hypothetical protein [Chitinilyticum aquatile]|uniref:hypothetical protein n=1 Tax=Chitinilyticum aquatile TaxID=362520 RepID=UPI000404DA95|nr:hypothetical protein [Chitinilyticum aquatile]
MKTGKIIHYNQNEGKGIINADGQPHEFHIQQWRGNEAPRLNASVRIELAETGEMAIHPLAVAPAIDTEQLAALGGQLGQTFKQHGGNMGARLLSLHGIPVLAAYAVFVFSGLFLTLITTGNGLAVSLHSWSDSLGREGVGNSLTQVVFWLSVVSIAAPLFVRHKLTPLLLCLPLLTGLLVMYDFYSLYSFARTAMEQMYGSLSGFGGLGKAIAERANEEISSQLSFGKVLSKAGLGFYGMQIAGACLALLGITRCLKAITAPQE